MKLINILMTESSYTDELEQHVEVEHDIFASVRQDLDNVISLARERLSAAEFKLPEHEQQYKSIIELSTDLKSILDEHESSYDE